MELLVFQLIEFALDFGLLLLRFGLGFADLTRHQGYLVLFFLNSVFNNQWYFSTNLGLGFLHFNYGRMSIAVRC